MSFRTPTSICSLCSQTASRTSRKTATPTVFLRRSQSTSTSAATEATSPVASSSSSSPSTASSSSSSTRLIASIVLSRPPRRLSPLSSFEKEYYKYARKVNKAIAGEFNSEWYFRKGSQGEQAWRDLVESAEQGKELESIPSEESVQESKDDGDLHNLERKQDRTLYLLAKKDRQEHSWQFPQGGVEESESLSEASARELLEEFGSDLDVWQVGKVPAAHYGYQLPKPASKGETEAKVFFMPARIMRGTPQPNKEEGLVDYAWCTKEEVQKKVNNDGYWSSIAAVLSH